MAEFSTLGNYVELDEGLVDFKLLPNSTAALMQLTRLQLEDALPSDSLAQFSALRRLKELSIIVEDYERETVALPLPSSLLTRLQLHCRYCEVS